LKVLAVDKSIAHYKVMGLDLCQVTYKVSLKHLIIKVPFPVHKNIWFNETFTTRCSSREGAYKNNILNFIDLWNILFLRN